MKKHLFIFNLVVLISTCCFYVVTHAQSNFNNYQNSVKLCENLDNLNESQRSKAVILEFYNCFLNQDFEGMLNFIADDVLWIHEGPYSERTPLYNTFYGKDGFIEWISLFDPTSVMTNFDIRYIVADNNIVTTSVLEGSYREALEMRIFIENFHYFEINSENKISSAIIISDTNTFYNALVRGEPGNDYKTEYEIKSYDIAYPFSKHYYKHVSKKAFNSIISGNPKKIKFLLAENIEIAVPSNSETTPISGKYTGYAGVEEFFKRINLLKDSENLDLEFEYLLNACDANKVNIKYRISEKNSGLSTIAFMSFQFNEYGQICYIYNFLDTETISTLFRD